MIQQVQAPPAGATRAASGEPSSRKVFWRLGQFVRPDRGPVGLVLLLTLLGGAANAAGPYFVGRAINVEIATKNEQGLLSILLLLTGVFILGAITQMAQQYLLGWLAQRILLRIRLALMSKLNQVDVAFFDQHASGDLISLLTNDLSRLSGLFGQSLMQTLGAVAFLIIVLGAMLVLDWRLALLSFAVLPLIFGATLYLAKRTFLVSLRSRATMSALTEATREELTNIRVSQAFARTAVNQQRFQALNAANRAVGVQATVSTDASTPVNSILAALSLAIVIGFGTLLVIQGQTTVGVVVAFILYVQQFNIPVQLAANLYNQAQSAVASTTRIYALLDTPITVEDAPAAQDLGPIRGEVVFQGVTFGYQPDQPSIRDISFTIPAGKTVAVVGATGAGKSTLVNLLVRFYDLWAGRITVDGQDIRTVTRESLRREMAIILQESTLFAGTIADNIRYGQLDATQEAITAAATLANAHAFIMALPKGYETRISARGTELSNGQRQLLVFARALVRNPKILILDEATATLDPETERLLQAAIANVLAQRTSLVIAHRLSTIRNADLILVLDKGRLAESGTHDQLLAAGGLYANLVNQQAGGIIQGGIAPAQLQAIPLFARLDAPTLTALAQQLQREQYAAGDAVVRQGEFGDKFYIIKSGEAAVLVAGESSDRQVNLLAAGDYFGELLLLSGDPRTATVRATTPVEIYSMRQEDFATLLEQESSVRQVVAATAARRREALAGAGRADAA